MEAQLEYLCTLQTRFRTFWQQFAFSVGGAY